MPKKSNYLQCVEFNNLYLDNEFNINRTNSILNLLDYGTYSCSYAYIKHDKDMYLSDTFNDKFQLIGRCGDLKKVHYHCYVKFNSPVLIDTFELNFNVSPSDYHIFKPKDFDNKLLYLAHVLHPDKYQYSLNDIHTNIRDYVDYLYSSISNIKSNDVIQDAMDFISSIDVDYFVSVNSLLNFLYSQGWSLKDFKSSMFTINLLINEHNKNANRCSSFIEQKALEYMNEHNYFDKKIIQVVEQFGFGRFDIDGDEYICCKAKNKKN